MTSIAAVTTAPIALQNTDAALSDLFNWFKLWIGWGVHRKQDWALSQLPQFYLTDDVSLALRNIHQAQVTRTCTRHLLKLMDPDSTNAAPSAIDTPSVIRVVNNVLLVMA